MATFKKEFFRELYKLLAVYDTLYVTEDGNIYRSAVQAERRASSRRKLAAINGEADKELRFASVVYSNPPTCAEDLEKLFEAQDAARRKAAKSEQQKAISATEGLKLMSDAEAEAALNKLRGGKEKEKPTEAGEVKTGTKPKDGKKEKPTEAGEVKTE